MSGRASVRAFINPLVLASGLLAIVLLFPISAVFIAASGNSEGLWAHLSATVLPYYVGNTLVLMAGVAVVSLVFGVSSAWVVTRYKFTGSGLFEWMLLLPAAVPGYLIAYTYTDFLEYSGPVQMALRGLFGWTSARDYWFPEIRSMHGAALVMGAVLYPYIYLMARAAFLTTPASMFDAGRLTSRNLFWSIALPLARPAIVAGLALVLMETISDFGTVEFFAIETLTLGIFNVWLGMNNLAAASQIACVAFVLILALLTMEKMARARRRFADTSRRANSMAALPAHKWTAVMCILVCSTPIIIGFMIPVGVLLSFILKGYSIDLTGAAADAAINSLTLSAMVAALVIASAIFMGLVSAYGGGRLLPKADSSRINWVCLSRHHPCSRRCDGGRASGSGDCLRYWIFPWASARRMGDERDRAGYIGLHRPLSGCRLRRDHSGAATRPAEFARSEPDPWAHIKRRFV